MRTRGRFLVGVALGALAASCGRIGFSDKTDGGTGGGDAQAAPDAPLAACNVPIALGPLTAGPARDGAPWLAAALHGTRIIAAYSTSTGVDALAIDVGSGSARLLGVEPQVLDECGGDLDVAYDGTRALITTLTLDGDNTAAAVLDDDSSIAASSTLPIVAGAPQHSAVMPGGDFAVAGTDADDPEEVIEVGPDASVVVATPLGFLTNVSGGSITPLAGGGYAVAYYTGANECETRTLEANLTPVVSNATVIGGCELIRLSGTRTVGAYATVYTDDADDLVVQRFDDAGALLGSGVSIGSAQGPSRVAGDAAAYWAAVESDTSLAYAPIADDATIGTPIVATPYSGTGERYTYYVVADAGAAFALWIDDPTFGGELYAMRLCTP